MNRYKKTRPYRAKATVRPGYLHRISELRDAGMFPAGRVAVLHVAHDGWCSALRGGPCECVPDLAVEVLPPLDGEPAP